MRCGVLKKTKSDSASKSDKAVLDMDSQDHLLKQRLLGKPFWPGLATLIHLSQESPNLGTQRSPNASPEVTFLIFACPTTHALTTRPMFSH